MNTAKYCGTVGLFMLAVLGSGLLAQSDPQGLSVEVRRTQECTVLYTIHRGSFDTVGATIAETIAAAARQGAYPKGTISFAYLNNPAMTSGEHHLTEIRIPVGEEALKLAGTLGRFTDIKKLPSVEVVAAIKPEGLGTPASVYQGLYAWMLRNGCLPAERPWEVFLTNARAGDYSKMKSEIVIPITRVAVSK